MNYDGDEVLQSVTDTDGYTILFGYSDRGLLESVTAPDGAVYKYEFAAFGEAALPNSPALRDDVWPTFSVLSKVIYPDENAGDETDNPFTKYHYANKQIDASHAARSSYLSGITDERGIKVKEWDYDYSSLSSGVRAIASRGANGVEETLVDERIERKEYSVKNAKGKESIYRYIDTANVLRLASIDGVATSNCAASSKSRDYDTDGYQTVSINAEGQRKNRDVDAATGLPNSVTYGAGTPEAVTVNYTWDQAVRKPTEVSYPGLTASISYGSDQLPSEVTLRDTTGHTTPYRTSGKTRTWRYDWQSGGLLNSLDGPLPGGEDTISFGYDQNGNISSITNELGHVTTIDAVDGMGRPISITEPNGLVTAIAYTPRGWVEKVTQTSGNANRVTAFEYDVAGNLTRIVFPAGNWLSYIYDDASWLTKVTSSAGDEINYQHDLLGNITRASFGGTGATASFAMQYDDLGRLTQRLGGAGDRVTYTYDRADRMVSMEDGLGRSWLTGFDALDRVISQSDPESHSVDYELDADGDLTKFRDGRGLSTQFARNGFGEVIREVSPDRSITDYWHDSAGRVTRMRDAAGDDVRYKYDAAGRLTSEAYPNQRNLNIKFTYDRGKTGKGFLTAISNKVAGYRFSYSGFSELTSMVATINKKKYRLVQKYNSNGQLARITLPSKRTITFAYDANNRITSVSTKVKGSGAQPVISGVEYASFGPMTGYTFGNGASANFGLDASYRLSALRVSGLGPTLVSKSYAYDGNNRVIAITDHLESAYSATYAYTADGRLASADGPWGEFDWSYDPVGNRLTETRYQASTLLKDDEYTYSASSNRLLSVSARGGGVNRMISYTDDGNIDTDVQTAQPSRDYDYGRDGRLRRVRVNGTSVATYDYDAFEHRVRRLADGEERHFVFLPSGQLIGEYDGVTGAVVTEYIWLADRLVATVDGSGTLSYVQTGHLGQPLLVMDGSGAATWTGETTPFGVFVATTGSASDPDLRFPGQWLEAGSGLYHNWHRDYDPSLGRYIQADPLGIAAGQSVYGYVRQEPTNLVDPKGLIWESAWDAANAAFSGGRAAGFAMQGRWDEAGDEMVNLGADLAAMCTPGVPAGSRRLANNISDFCAAIKKKCVSQCTDQWIEDPNSLPGSGSNTSGRMRKCVRRCMRAYGCNSY
ncbi:MAG: RHS repeat-associated core domain-containing protein [Pseudomonadota bacterium]